MLEAHVENLLMRVFDLETKNKGGRPGKTLLVKAEGVCGLHPDIDSDQCPDASLYRRRQGCGGDACHRASSTYYKKIRDDIAETAVVPE
jgi:hypothetical protein